MDKEIVKQNSDQKTPSKTKAVKQRCQRSLPLIIITTMLAVLFTSLVYYLYFNQEKINRDIQLLQQQVANQQQQITNLQAQLQQLTVQQRQLMLKLQTSGFSKEAQVLVSAVYSLQQAQSQLQLYADVPNTITILQTIVNRIEEMHSQQLNTLAATIHEDINRLQALKLTDLHLLQQQFVNLSQDIDALTLHPAQPSKQNKVYRQNSSGWQQALHNSWNALRKVVVVQRTDNTFTPLLQQQQLLSFKQYLQNLAQQALWGALHHDNAFYHQRLQQMRQALRQYLLLTDRQSRLLQARLAQLQKESVAVKLPQQLTSLKLARQLQTNSVSIVQEKAK